MARTMQRFAAENPDHDPDMMADATELERRALEAIKLYQIGQKESFREFAMIHTRQAMVLARNKVNVPDPHAPRPDLPPRQF